MLRKVPCFLLILFFASCTFQTKSGEADRDSLVVLFTGDVLLDRGVRPLAERKGVEWLFGEVSPLFREADAAVVNLECPLADTPSPLAKQFVFRADRKWAQDLRKAGVTHASLANNHTVDQGFPGLSSTVDALSEAEIQPMGCGVSMEERLKPSVIEKGRLRMALFSAVLFPIENWVSCPEMKLAPCQVDASTLARAVRSYRKEHPEDCIVCVLHWGVEFQHLPTPQQRREATLLMNAGSDALIGHHPHVCEPLEYLQGRPVFYSLGNFVFDQHLPEACVGQMARLVLKSDTLEVSEQTVDILRCRPIPRWKSARRQPLSSGSAD